jgi:hypothetical protein
LFLVGEFFCYLLLDGLTATGKGTKFALTTKRLTDIQSSRIATVDELNDYKQLLSLYNKPKPLPAPSAAAAATSIAIANANTGAAGAVAVGSPPNTVPDGNKRQRTPTQLFKSDTKKKASPKKKAKQSKVSISSSSSDDEVVDFTVPKPTPITRTIAKPQPKLIHKVPINGMKKHATPVASQNDRDRITQLEQQLKAAHDQLDQQQVPPLVPAHTSYVHVSERSKSPTPPPPVRDRDRSHIRSYSPPSHPITIRDRYHPHHPVMPYMSYPMMANYSHPSQSTMIPHPTMSYPSQPMIPQCEHMRMLHTTLTYWASQLRNYC